MLNICSIVWGCYRINNDEFNKKLLNIMEKILWKKLEKQKLFAQ